MSIHTVATQLQPQNSPEGTATEQPEGKRESSGLNMAQYPGHGDNEYFTAVNQ